MNYKIACQNREAGKRICRKCGAEMWVVKPWGIDKWEDLKTRMQ